MKSSSLNHVYRIVWNAALGVWQAVSEVTRGHGKTKASKAQRLARRAAALAALGALGAAQPALALPTGGNVVGGSATISQTSNALNITQTTDRAAIDWQGFSVAKGESVNFQQPSSSSVALNRVLGNDVSVIQGAINANGQVFLVNQNGVLFTPTAQVNVGGIVASTQNISLQDFMAGNYKFSGSSTASVENQGSITAGKGGVVALIAAKVVNSGSILAPQGVVGLAAGNTVVVDLGGPVKILVSEGALNTAIEQSGGIRADGGTVYLTAKAAGDLASSVINHTGVTQARTLATGEKGEIILLADMAVGTTKVSGTLDASAPDGGDGGFIETSAAQVKVLDGVRVTTLAARGLTGTWLIDPKDYTIAATGGDISGATLGQQLANNDITIQSSTGATDGNGDINVNDSVTWNSARTLTLRADRHVNINENITATDAAGKLKLEVGQGSTTGTNYNGGDYFIVPGRSVKLRSGNNFSLKKGSDGSTKTYTVLSYDPAVAQTSDLLAPDVVGNYALGSDVLLAKNTYIYGQSNGTASTWKGFEGEFHGLGHTVSGFNVDTPRSIYVSGGSLSVAPFMSFLSLNTLVRDITVDKPTINISGSLVGYAGGLLGVVKGGGTPTNGNHTQIYGVRVQDANFNISTTSGTTVVSGVVASGQLLTTVQPISYVIKDTYASGSFTVVSTHATTGGITFGGIASSTAAMDRVGFEGTVNLSRTSTASGGTLSVAALAPMGTVMNWHIRNAYSRADFTLGGNFAISNLGGVNNQKTGLTVFNFDSNNMVEGIPAGVSNTLMDNNWNTGGLIAGSTLLQDAVGFGNAGSYSNNNYNSSKLINNTAVSNFVGAVALTPAQITQQASYPSFDFTNTWVMGTNGPVLRSSQVKAEVTSSPIYISLVCGVLCNNTYGDNVSLTFGAFTAASGGTAVTDANITGTATYSVAKGGVVQSGLTLGNLTDAGTYTITYSGGLTAGNASYVINPGSAVTWTVNPRTLTVTLQASTGNPLSKTYDGNVSLALATQNFLLGNFVGTQGTGASISQTTGSFNSKDVATANTVTALLASNQLQVASGVNASNYVLPTQVSAAGSIAQKALTVSGITAANKTYDGGTSATLNGTATVDTSGVIGSDDVSVGAGTVVGNFADKNVGTGKAVSVSGLTLTGTDAGNYALSAPGLSADITAKAISIAASTVTKTYDGTTSATGSGTLSVGSLATGDSISNAGTQSFTNKDAGTGKTVTASGVKIGDGSSVDMTGNYAITYVDNTASTITPKALTMTGSTVATKTYDGTNTATVNVGTLSGLVTVNGVTETLGTTTAAGTFAGKNASDTAQNVTAVYTLANGANVAHKASNYTLADQTLTGKINKRALTVTGTTVANKTYDALTGATVTVGTLGNLVTGETLGTTTATGSFANKHVAVDANGNVIAKDVTVAYTLADGANGGMASNYSLANETKTATINKKVLTGIENIKFANRIYDGTTTATLEAFIGQTPFISQTYGRIAGDAVTVTPANLTGQFASKDAGIHLATITGGTLGGADGGNYSAAGITGLGARIIQKPLTIALSSITAANKVYDGTNVASVTINGPVTGFVPGESATVTATGAFVAADGLTAVKDVGNGIRVSATPVFSDATGGALASNYSLPQVTGRAPNQIFVKANITPKELTITGSTVADKTYDGTTTAAIAAGTLAGLVTGETLGTTTAAGTFASKNASDNAQNVTVAYTLANGTNAAHKASNYTLANQTLTGKINKRALTIADSTVANKVYDGNVNGTVTVGTLGNLVTGEMLGTTTATGTFADKDAGTGKDVTVKYTLADGSSGKASNYSLADQTLKGSINQKAISIAAAAVSKTYDGTTSATGNGTLLNSVLASGDAISNVGKQAFLDKNVGTGNKTVRASGVVIQDGSSVDMTGNYAITYVDNNTSTITQKALTVTAVAATKTYDGTTSAAGTGTVGTLVSGDTVSNAGSQAFTDKNAGTGKTVRASGVTIMDGSSVDMTGNYAITYVDNTASTITAKALTMTGSSVVTKTYDGSKTASVSVGTLSGLVAGETLGTTTASGSFDSKNAGTGKDVTVKYTLANGVSTMPMFNSVLNTACVTPMVACASTSSSSSSSSTGTGVLASNYSLADQTLKGAITQKTLSVSGITASNKTYDGGQSATVSTAAAQLSGLLEGDQLSVSATGQFADKQVGTGKAVTLGSTYTGADKGNYAIVDQATTTASITRKALSVSGITAASKVYDATPDAKIGTSQAVFDGLVNGDVLTVATTGQFVDSLVGNNKVVKLSSTYSGADVGNYLISSQEITRANITPATTQEAVLTIVQQQTQPVSQTPPPVQTMQAAPRSDKSGDDKPSFFVPVGVPQIGPLQVVVVNGGIKLPNGMNP